MKPKNCEWCGSESFIWAEFTGRRERRPYMGWQWVYEYEVNCFDCPNRGVGHKTRSAAIAKWNLHKKEEK